ncbi:MAG TPA: oligosaccharide flippase family protein, partial [Rugosimonospora sp.]|nr:oligosaccharide flippase family protein [Rugosimonospora sp.]
MVSLAGNASLQVLGLVTAVIAARLFGPRVRGELAAATAWALTLSAVGDVGLSQAVPFFAAKKQPRLGATALTVVLLVTVGLAPGFWLAERILRYGLSDVAIVYVVVALPTSLTTAYVGGLFQGESRHLPFTATRVLSNFPYLAGVVTIGLLGGRTSDQILAVSIVISFAVIGAVVIWAMRSARSFSSPDSSVLKRLVSYGLRTYPGNLAWIGNQRA